MRVSEVLQVQFPQARFVSVDTDVATQSRTAHSCDRYGLLRFNNQGNEFRLNGKT